MKKINRWNEVVKLLSAARCCAKAIIDVAAVKFRFGAVEFVEKLLFDEVVRQSSHSDSVNLFLIDTRERKAVKCETSSPRRISVSVLGCLLACWSKKYLSARSPSWLRITVYNEAMSIVKISLFWPGKLKSRKVLSA